MKQVTDLLNGVLGTAVLLCALALQVWAFRMMRRKDREGRRDRLAHARWQRNMNRDIRARGGLMGEYDGIDPELAKVLKQEPEDPQGPLLLPPRGWTHFNA